jgi:hypothetical protein
MKTYKVVLAPDFITDLFELYQYVAFRDGKAKSQGVSTNPGKSRPATGKVSGPGPRSAGTGPLWGSRIFRKSPTVRIGLFIRSWMMLFMF